MGNRDELDPSGAALILIDIQPDFLPGGALPVQAAGDFLASVERLMNADLFRLQVATQDWHPPGHVSFASSHEGHEPFDQIELYGHEQTLWPDHCVQDTDGAELHPSLPWKKVSSIVRKGADPEVDSYSGFRNNWDKHGERPATGLAGYLRERDIGTVFCCGLARDFCVHWTARDAADASFETFFIWNLTRPVDPASDDAVRQELEDRGVTICASEQLRR